MFIVPNVSEQIRPGLRVLPVSGVAIGHVLDVANDRFQVQTEHEILWLSISAVFTIEAERVTLICTEEGLKRYEVKPPER